MLGKPPSTKLPTTFRECDANLHGSSFLELRCPVYFGNLCTAAFLALPPTTKPPSREPQKQDGPAHRERTVQVWQSSLQLFTVVCQLVVPERVRLVSAPPDEKPFIRELPESLRGGLTRYFAGAREVGAGDPPECRSGQQTKRGASHIDPEVVAHKYRAMRLLSRLEMQTISLSSSLFVYHPSSVSQRAVGPNAVFLADLIITRWSGGEFVGRGPSFSSVIECSSRAGIAKW